MKHTFTVVIDTDTHEHAQRVITERIYHDEDYGFPYSIDLAQGGPVAAYAASGNPVTADVLREDWTDNPNLDDAQRATLNGLPDGTLQEALDTSFRRHHNEDTWFTLLDSIRSEATDTLLEGPPWQSNSCA